MMINVVGLSLPTINSNTSTYKYLNISVATTDDKKHGGTVPTNHNFKLKYIEVLQHYCDGTVLTHHNFKLKYIEVLKH